MSDSVEEDKETYSGLVVIKKKKKKKKKQRGYIKTECLRDNTEPIITANLCETCSHDTVNCSTEARWIKWFQEGRRSMADDPHANGPSTAIDNTLIVIVSTLLDTDRQMMAQGMEWVSGIIINNKILYFN